MNARPDLVAAAFHWVEYTGLLAGIGCFVVRRVGRMPPRISWANPPMHLAFGAALLGGVGLLALAPAWPVAARVVAEAAALFLCLRGRLYVAPFAVVAALLLPFSSHAAALFPAAGAEFADALHVVSAGMWAGGILALATLRPPHGWRSEEARLLVGRFGRVALIAFGVTALTGVLRATEQLAAPADLWTTTYGVVLVAKTAGVLAMVVLSAASWRRGFPTARAEASVALAVIAATSVLAALPVAATIG